MRNGKTTMMVLMITGMLGTWGCGGTGPMDAHGDGLHGTTHPGPATGSPEDTGGYRLRNERNDQGHTDTNAVLKDDTIRALPHQ